MEPKEIDKTLFEQHWIHSRHIESERMWIMGIWLGVTAVMFKETWFSAQSGLTLTALRTMGWAHLILTGAVLVIILKLQLAYDVHNSRIKEISRGASRRHLWWSGCRTWVPPNGAVYSTILCAAIFPDINLLTCQCLQSRFPTESENWPVGLVIAFCIFGIYQFVLWFSHRRLSSAPRIPSNSLWVRNAPPAVGLSDDDKSVG